MLNILSNAQIYLLRRDAFSKVRWAEGKQAAFWQEGDEKQRSFSQVL